MNKSFAYVFLFIGIVLMLFILIDDNKKSKRIGEEIWRSYKQEISGIVLSVTQKRGTIRLRLKNGVNTPYYFGVTRNYSLNPYDLDDFLQSGDSVFKASNSDEFYVFREDKKYRFVLEKRINKQ